MVLTSVFIIHYSLFIIHFPSRAFCVFRGEALSGEGNTSHSCAEGQERKYHLQTKLVCTILNRELKS
jgi:hypothetical protein